MQLIAKGGQNKVNAETKPQRISRSGGAKSVLMLDCNRV